MFLEYLTQRIENIKRSIARSKIELKEMKAEAGQLENSKAR